MNTGFISKATPVQDFEKELEELRKKAKDAPNIFEMPKQQPQEVSHSTDYASESSFMQMAHEFYEHERKRAVAKQEAKMRIL